MKTASRILFLWVISIAFIVVAQIAHPEVTLGDISDVLFPASNALAFILAYYLSRKEIRKGPRTLFINFFMLLLFSAFSQPIFQLMKGLLALPSVAANFYYSWYFSLIYLFLLSFSVLYVVIDQVTDAFAHKFVFAFSTVFVAASVAFYPLVMDPLAIARRPEVQNVYTIRQAVEALRSVGNVDPSVEDIAARVNLNSVDRDGEQRNLSVPEKLASIPSYLGYVGGDNVVLLVYKPYWLRCAKFGLLNIMFYVLYFIRQYFVDSNKGAYQEKIVLCMLPYCVLEVLHFYSFVTVRNMVAFDTVWIIGRYLSMAGILTLCGLLALRLRFLNTVEGGYYETHLLERPEGITRWRDGLDKWVLRNFMNPGDLERRFVIHRRVDE